MKNKILFAIPLVVSIYSAHANDCGNLNISIDNRSGHICTLRTSHLVNGQIINGEVPGVIEHGVKSPMFTIQQIYSSGPSIRLEFDCNDKIISIVSRQDLCVMYAGSVSGDYTSSNNIHAGYIARIGSWWNSLPGEINWTIG